MINLFTQTKVMYRKGEKFDVWGTVHTTEPVSAVSQLNSRICIFS